MVMSWKYLKLSKDKKNWLVYELGNNPSFDFNKYGPLSSFYIKLK